MGQEIIRITESDLHSIVRESVYQILEQKQGVNEGWKNWAMAGALGAASMFGNPQTANAQQTDNYYFSPQKKQPKMSLGHGIVSSTITLTNPPKKQTQPSRKQGNQWTDIGLRERYGGDKVFFVFRANKVEFHCQNNDDYILDIDFPLDKNGGITLAIDFFNMIMNKAISWKTTCDGYDLTFFKKKMELSFNSKLRPLVKKMWIDFVIDNINSDNEVGVKIVYGYNLKEHTGGEAFFSIEDLQRIIELLKANRDIYPFVQKSEPSDEEKLYNMLR